MLAEARGYHRHSVAATMPFEPADADGTSLAIAWGEQSHAMSKCCSSAKDTRKCNSIEDTPSQIATPPSTPVVCKKGSGGLGFERNTQHCVAGSKRAVVLLDSTFRTRTHQAYPHKRSWYPQRFGEIS